MVTIPRGASRGNDTNSELWVGRVHPGQALARGLLRAVIELVLAEAQDWVVRVAALVLHTVVVPARVLAAQAGLGGIIPVEHWVHQLAVVARALVARNVDSAVVRNWATAALDLEKPPACV